MQPTLPKYANLIPKSPTRPSSTLSWFRRVWAFCIGAPTVVVLSRGKCHRLTLDVKGVPRRMVQSSIGLQLGHLTGQPVGGFAWRLAGAQAEVWYWFDEPSLELPAAEVLPCPEPLLRAAMPVGLHLIQCAAGFEAVSIKDGGVTHRTRWFAALPLEPAWQQFVRDAGADPDQHPLPVANVVALQSQPQKGWVLVSTVAKPLSPQQWAVWGAVAVAGAMLFGLLSYSLKLVVNSQALKKEYAILAEQSAATLKLQREIEILQQPITAIVQVQPRVLQTRLMAALADAGVFDESKKVHLQEWEYRNGRVRIQFSVPTEGFELGKFLESIEKLGLFKNVRLLQGTPPQSVGLQAELLTPLRSVP